MSYNVNHQKKVFSVVCCSGMGRPITTMLRIEGVGDYLINAAQDISQETTVTLSRKGSKATSYEVQGEHNEENIELYGNSRNLQIHEEWHRERYTNGFKKVHELGYGFVDESMAYAIEDSNDTNVKLVSKRLTTSKKLILFYQKALKLCKNGGLQPNHINKMKELIEGCGFIVGHKNWAAFMHCLHNLGAYAVCYSLIQENGITGAKQIFFETIDLIEKKGEPKAGLDLLVYKLRSKAEYYPTSFPLPKKKGIGTPESNKINVVFRNEKFDLRLWTEDRGVEKVVRDVYRFYESKLAYMLGPLDLSCARGA